MIVEAGVIVWFLGDLEDMGKRIAAEYLGWRGNFDYIPVFAIVSSTLLKEEQERNRPFRQRRFTQILVP